MMAGKTIVILGGGVGGLVAARELRSRLGREHRVVLVDRDGRHVFWPSLLWLQVGVREPKNLVRDLSRLERKGIEVVRGTATRIGPAEKALEVDGRQLAADYLVLSPGAQLAPEQIEGLSVSGYNLYSLEGATAIRDNRKSLSQGDLVLLVAQTPFKCPAAPYEAAMLLDHDLRKRKVRDRVRVSIYTPEPGPMPVAGPDASAGVKRMIEERGIEFHPQRVIAKVEAAARTLHFADGSTARFDFLVYIPPHVAPAVVKESGLAGQGGWVPVDRHTMETRFTDVFAIGDVTGIPLAVGMPLPKAGVFARREAEAVAQTIAARITGKGSPGSFDGHGECFVETGGGKAGFGRGNFYAEPRPAIKLDMPTRYWHVGKVLFEKNWFRRWL
jgi:sulfide:quinone oxidoreductase